VTNGSSDDPRVVVDIAGADADHVGGEAADGFENEPVSRFRRRIERFKGAADAGDLPGSLDDESELRLQLMLLREENARLKSARHQPASPGSVIDRVRVLGTPATDAEDLDNAWALLSDCMRIREGLDEACLEIQSAIDSVRDRLLSIAERIESSMPAAGAGSNGQSHSSA
jgi:hypothetical protein